MNYLLTILTLSIFTFSNDAHSCNCRRYIMENAYKYADLIVIGTPTQKTRDLRKKHPFLATNKGAEGVSKPSVNMPYTWPYQEIQVTEILKGSIRKEEGKDEKDQNKILVKVNMRDCGLEEIINEEHLLLLFHHKKNEYSVTECSGSQATHVGHPKFDRKMFRLRKKIKAL